MGVTHLSEAVQDPARSSLDRSAAKPSRSRESTPTLAQGTRSVRMGSTTSPEEAAAIALTALSGRTVETQVQSLPKPIPALLALPKASRKKRCNIVPDLPKLPANSGSFHGTESRLAAVRWLLEAAQTGAQPYNRYSNVLQMVAAVGHLDLPLASLVLGFTERHLLISVRTTLGIRYWPGDGVSADSDSEENAKRRPRFNRSYKPLFNMEEQLARAKADFPEPPSTQKPELLTQLLAVADLPSQDAAARLNMTRCEFEQMYKSQGWSRWTHEESRPETPEKDSVHDLAVPGEVLATRGGHAARTHAPQQDGGSLKKPRTSLRPPIHRQDCTSSCDPQKAFSLTLNPANPTRDITKIRLLMTKVAWLLEPRALRQPWSMLEATQLNTIGLLAALGHLTIADASVALYVPISHLWDVVRKQLSLKSWPGTSKKGDLRRKELIASAETKKPWTQWRNVVDHHALLTDLKKRVPPPTGQTTEILHQLLAVANLPDVEAAACLQVTVEELTAAARLQGWKWWPGNSWSTYTQVWASKTARSLQSSERPLADILTEGVDFVSHEHVAPSAEDRQEPALQQNGADTAEAAVYAPVMLPDESLGVPIQTTNETQNIASPNDGWPLPDDSDFDVAAANARPGEVRHLAFNPSWTAPADAPMATTPQQQSNQRAYSRDELEQEWLNLTAP